MSHDEIIKLIAEVKRLADEAAAALKARTASAENR